MSETIGTAVVGVGTYGEVHARTYQKDNRVKLISVWSRSRERGRKIGEKYGCEYTADLDDIARDERIKIVSVATPDFAHTEPVIKMLHAGKHVLVEKPMATSVKECQQILNVHNRQFSTFKSQSKLMVNFHNRWYPPLAQSKKLIDDDKIGKPVNAFARLSDIITVPTEIVSWSNKTGPQWFLFPHTIDLIRWIFGQEAKSVYALGKKGVLQSKGIDTYDVIQAQVAFEESIAIFESSWILPESWRNNLIEFKIDIYGEKGRIGVFGDNEGIEISTGNYKTPLLYDFVTEEEPIKYFIDCVINDKQPSPSGEDGLAVTRIIECIEESLKKGEVVNITT
ncbi:MAG: Gfo/Idh/MocA family oxidoreductase [Candidatus Omnitrophica bacterium]|nr:Gfo/Idh/MocA family oxidoreductase [Candidatus Omnitrophota bacterium]